MEIAKEVVDCGLWYLAEYENGEFTLNHQPKEFADVKAYLKKQSRFQHLTDEDDWKRSDVPRMQSGDPYKEILTLVH